MSFNRVVYLPIGLKVTATEYVHDLSYITGQQVNG